MWLIYTLISNLFISFVMYTDEHLATSNKLPEKANIHTKVGSVLLISALMSFFGSGIIALSTRDINLVSIPLTIALISSVVVVGMYASYFYLLQLYPVHLVGPLFQLSSVWLLLIELAFGGTITFKGLIAVLILVYGAYILDAGTFKLKIPTKLLIYSLPATLTSAISVYMARYASQFGSITAFSFYQLIAIGVVGIFLFLLVKPYRDGFFYRIKHQGKKFLGLSLVNESFAEGSLWVGNLAVAIAPIATYVSALGGISNIFLLVLLAIFPQGERSRVTRIQWMAIALITFGVLLIER